ncbi:MAG: IscS subfamily cysteine desulfurase [Planctomycetota bacterium]
MHLPIYLDNHATTPVDPRVLAAMFPYFTDEFGNAASRNHAFGWNAEDAVENAREVVAKAMNASAKELVFTSGATESDNIAIKGVAAAYGKPGSHIVSSPLEHKAILDPIHRLEEQGFTVTWLKPDRNGMFSAEQVAEAVTDKTILVSLMAANNEIGNVYPLAAYGAAIKAKNKNTLFHTDATQAYGKVPIDVEAMKIDLLSLSGHKIYGPKGIGALYVRRRNPRVRIKGIIDGGGHERQLRSGTLNVPGIVGLAKAVELCVAEMDHEAKRLSELRDYLHKRLAEGLEEIHLNGHPDSRLPGCLNISFAFVEGEALMMTIHDVAVSSGSACTSASLEPSHVLKGIGVGDELAHSSLRFGLGRFTTKAEIDYTVDHVIAGVKRLREMSPLYDMFKEGVDMKQVQWASH